MYSDVPIWKVAPFFRLIIFFITGILIQWYLRLPLKWLVIITTLPVFTLILFNYIRPGKRFGFRIIQGCLIYLLLFFAGTITAWLKVPSNSNHWYGNMVSSNDYILLSIAEVPIQKNNAWKAEATIQAIINNKVHSAWGTVQLYGKPEDCSSLHYGQRLIIRSMLQEFPASGNPGGFDYKSYMSMHGIYHRMLIRKNGFIVAGNDSSFFQTKLLTSRKYALGVLQKYIPGKENVSMAEALLLGYKEDLDKDLVKAYSNTGVVHIIAISGLHLGFIYLLLQKLLSIIPFARRSKMTGCIIILFGLWFFTFLTGSAPSALRSAVMFSFIVTGKSFTRQHTIYNALCVSAFFLLCYDPYLVTDLGFQLSYLAVISIVWLQQPVERLFFFNNKILGKLWSLVSVSLVAQLLTTPLCIYYFHQFPNLFFVSNLVAVPVSTIILFGCILVVSIGWIPILASVAGKIVSFIIGFLDEFITSINHLPFSQTKNINLSLNAAVLLYFGIISLALWIVHRYKVMLPAFLLFILLLSLNRVNEQAIMMHQCKLIIYNIPGHSAIDCIERSQSVFYGDSAMQAAKMKQQYLDPSRLAFRISAISNYKIKSFVAVINNKLILGAAGKIPIKGTFIPVDVLIISSNGAFSIHDLVPAILPRMVIFDSSNSLWKIDKWINECEQLHLSFYSVARSGAIIYNIN